jgi:uncharacterized LabA/DUF88 family protein
MDRVVVFIDYQNVHGWARRKFIGERAHPADGHIAPLPLAELVTNRRRRPSQLTEVRVYRGRPNPERQPGAARANDRQTAAWERAERVTVIRRNLQYPQQYPTVPATEKGIDVAIAVDMIRLAMSGDMDAAILFSCDKDLLPAVEMIWDYPSCHIEVAAWAQAPRLRISGTQLPWCHTLSQADFHHVRDTFDYSTPGGP